MRTETIEIYKYGELSDSAKDTARQWYREAGQDDSFWSESTIEDATMIAELMGIEIENIYFSGFSSQGDGAMFTGSYAYKKGSVKAVNGHVGDSDSCKEVKRIALELSKIQRPSFYQLNARVTHQGHYSHENCANIEVLRDDLYRNEYASVEEDDAISEVLRDYMRWIYKQLETEYEYQNADEQVAENIIANEYEFEVNGERH